MAAAGIHFGLIYATVTGKRNNIFRSEVTRWYLGMLFVGGLLIAISLYAADLYPTLSASFRHGMFQFVSVVSTSGFATADSNTWTPFAVIILIFGSIVCACAGSTAGGIKVNRMVLAGKMMSARLKLQQHPNAVIRIRLDGVIQDNEVLHSVMIYIVAYLMFLLLGTIAGGLVRRRPDDQFHRVGRFDGQRGTGIRRGRFDGQLVGDAVGFQNDEYVADAAGASGDFRSDSDLFD